MGDLICTCSFSLSTVLFKTEHLDEMDGRMSQCRERGRKRTPWEMGVHGRGKGFLTVLLGISELSLFKNTFNEVYLSYNKLHIFQEYNCVKFDTCVYP